ncbi:MAG: YhfZ family protein [Chloroflexota bacterium]
MATIRRSTSDLETKLANYLLSMKEGEQLLGIRDLTEKFGASLGSVSTTLNYFEEINAVSIKKRGRLGSTLEEKSLGKLWGIIEGGPMVIALTLPSFTKCEGLATAIYSLLNNAGVETYLIFIRGSISRLRALRSGHCHATVISAMAADELSGEGETTLLTLPPESFVKEHRVFYRRNRMNAGDPLIVGIDHDSFDVAYLTELEFGGDDVIFQELTFTQIDLHMAESAVDAAISNSDHLERMVGDEIASRSLSPEVRATISDRGTSAAFVARVDDVATQIVLTEVLVPNQVLNIQQQVVDRKLVPRY